MSYSPWGHKESDTTECLTLLLFTFNDRSSPRSTTPRDSLFYLIMEPILNETFTTQKVSALSNSGLKPPL